jgi:hypothetical protein
MNRHLNNEDKNKKQVTLRGGTNGREGKRRKERRRIWLNFLYKNEYRVFKPTEITIRRGLR